MFKEINFKLQELKTKDTFNDIKSKLEEYIKNYKEIEKNSPYSSEINKYIRSKEELDIYIILGLKEGRVNDKAVLKDESIDPDLKDSAGRTNLERMKRGLPPLDKDGNPYNLHHIGQSKDSPLAELPDKVHKNNDRILHDKNKPSEIDRDSFAKERAEHWKARDAEIEAQQKTQSRSKQ